MGEVFKMLMRLKWVLIIVGVLPLIVLAFNGALHLLSVENDYAVWIGYAVFVWTTAAAGYVGWLIAKQGELIKRVGEKVTAFMAPLHVHIVQIGFAAPPRPPQQIKEAIEGKVAAIQDAEKIKNQLQSSINEGERIKALAAAQAQANTVTQASLTATLIEWEKIKKWDGKLPQVSGGAMPMITLK